MKKILLLASAVALMASCSQSEDFGTTTELTTGEINFTNAFVNNSQRMAGEITNQTIATTDNTFGVWGYKTVNGTNTNVFDNVEVKYTAAGKWDYDNKRYWDAQASYDFIATMPQNAAVTNSDKTGAGTVTINDIPLSAPVTTGTDYLVSDAATVGANPSDKGTVKFTFKHILSKLNVFAKATYDGENTASKVTLNSLSLYLPTGTATYKEQNHAGPQATLALATTAGTSTDTWTWGTATYTAPSAVQTSDVDLNNATLYKKLTNSYFVAPTPTNLTTASELAENGAKLQMDIKFTVTYKDNTTEDFEYNKVNVEDLHTFTQGYITNLYVNINLNEIEFGVDKVISFANVTVADWTDSDDNFIDELGYSFNFKDLANLASAGTTADTKVASIDNYGNTTVGTSATALTYITDGKVYSDAACATEVKGATSNVDGMDVKVNGIAANTTQEVKTYYVKVVTNQGDSRVLTFTQEAASPILTLNETGTELSLTGAATYTAGNEVIMKVAQLVADGTAYVKVINKTTNEEVTLTTTSATAKITHESSIVSNLKLGEDVKFTPATGSEYSVEIHYEKDPLLKQFYTFKDGAITKN